MAKNDRKGEFVEVVRGRKVAPGTVGQIFWNDTQIDKFAGDGSTVDKVGVLVVDAVPGGPSEGEKVFLKAAYVEHVDVPEDVQLRAQALEKMDRQRFDAERGKRAHSTRYPKVNA